LALLFFFGILIVGEGGAMPFASFLAYLPAIIVPKKGYDLDSLRAGVTAGVSLFLVTISALTLLLPGAVIGPCRSADKCSFLGVALGAMSTGNALGMYLAAASAISLLANAKWYSFLLTLAGGFLLTELTASRSGLASWYVIVALVVTYRISQHLRSRLPLILAVFSVCILAAAIPLMNWRAAELTYRPILWWHAIALFERNPLLGYGASYWARDENRFRTGRGFSLGLNYSTHNIVLELLISAGAIGLLAFVIALFLAALNVREFNTSLYVIALVGVFVALSLTEVTSAPGRVYLFDGIGIYLFMAASSAVRVRVRSGPKRTMMPEENSSALATGSPRWS
jgi:O-antigen ligase